MSTILFCTIWWVPWKHIFGYCNSVLLLLFFLQIDSNHIIILYNIIVLRKIRPFFLLQFWRTQLTISYRYYKAIMYGVRQLCRLQQLLLCQCRSYCETSFCIFLSCTSMWWSFKLSKQTFIVFTSLNIIIVHRWK